MTLLEALERDEDGRVKIPVGGVLDDGTELPGVTTVDFVRSASGPYCDREVPLSDEDYQGLLSISSPMWRRNWQRWRAEGRI